jgi:hypothetical protein
VRVLWRDAEAHTSSTATAVSAVTVTARRDAATGTRNPRRRETPGVSRRRITDHRSRGRPRLLQPWLRERAAGTITRCAAVYWPRVTNNGPGREIWSQQKPAGTIARCAVSRPLPWLIHPEAGRPVKVLSAKEPCYSTLASHSALHILRSLAGKAIAFSSLPHPRPSLFAGAAAVWLCSINP